ncbi:MAG: alpha-glucosidase/alpha-galactosidase, partial [Deinococcus-Thermus bacterium]|nr:alpha-glucosidase/alpha-galactosidase [Deinococcota bacterium]
LLCPSNLSAHYAPAGQALVCVNVFGARHNPDALHLNYVNPMPMITWALNEASTIPTVGLCHSVPHTAHQLAADLGVPGDEIRYQVAGVNHLAFFLTLEHEGRDLYPRLREFAASGRVPDWNRVRYDAFRRLGRFVTESSEHFAEYVPWYLKKDRPDLVERFAIPIDEYPGRCEVYEVAWDFIERELNEPGSQSAEALRDAIDAADIDVMPQSAEHTVREFETLNEVHESVEYGAKIIHSIWTDTPRTVYGNVINDGSIDGLPDGCCVEVPCLVDGQGVQPTRVGALPPQLTALMRTHVNVQELVVRAVLDQDVRHVHHAALLEPRTAAQLDPDQIERLVNDLLEAHADLLPEAFRPPRRRSAA